MYSYKTAEDLLKSVDRTGDSLINVIIKAEYEDKGTEKTFLLESMNRCWEVMQESASRGLNDTPLSMGGLIGSNGAKLNRYSEKSPLCGFLAVKAAAYALAITEVNASMGKIVAAPTGGASGILPGIMLAMAEQFSYKNETVIEALLVAGAIGRIISTRTGLSGAEGGCQTECGVGAAMGAGAAVFLQGGSPRAIFNAAALTIKNVLGLVCDTVAGLVEVPCSKRNAMGVAYGLMAADMALSGIESVIPLDELAVALKKVGESIPVALRETGLGGCAATPTGIKVKRELEKTKL